MNVPGIVLADDEPLIAEIYGAAISSRGLAVHCVHDAAALLEAARRRRPALAVVDGRVLVARPGLARELVRQGVDVVLFTNDQDLFDRPPAGVCDRLLKVATRPQQLAEFVERRLRMLGEPGAEPRALRRTDLTA